jgi:hypothetical protein
VICRDVAGEHTGGPFCFCRPIAVPADLPQDEIERQVNLANKTAIQ